MALVAGTIIDEARDWHPTFNVRDHPDKALLRALDQYQRTLIARIVQVNEDYSRTILTTALPLATFANGITLPANLLVTGAEFLDISGNRHEVDLRPMMYRDDPAPRYTLFIGANVAYLRGAAQDWNAIQSIDIAYIPVPTALALLTDVLTIGDSARRSLVMHLCYMMATRGTTRSDVPPLNPDGFRRDWMRTEEEFLYEVATMRAGQTFTVREIW